MLEFSILGKIELLSNIKRVHSSKIINILFYFSIPKFQLFVFLFYKNLKKASELHPYHYTAQKILF